MEMLGMRSTFVAALFTAALLLPACSNPAVSLQPAHVRGAIQTVHDGAVTVATSEGPVQVQLAPSTNVATVVQSDRAHLTDGSFLGVTSVAGPDGSRRAVEIHVFPEALRGTGEGSRAWDWARASADSRMTNGTASRMTNGTVSSSKMTNGTVTAQEDGSSLTLQYKDGASEASQTISIPRGVPIVAIEPGQISDLQPGVNIFVIATRGSAGQLTAERVVAGKDGVVPPM